MNEHEYPSESKNKVPKGMTAFFLFVTVFLLGYIALYTPAISGWSFYDIFEKKMAEPEAPPGVEPARVSYSGDAAAIAEGEKIYVSNCAVCHNADGTGGIGSDLTGVLTFGASPEDLFTSIADGREGGMPPFRRQLSETKIRKLMAFLDTLRD
ncbi:cytochrome C [Prosthecochloris sp. GSB1]|uniref:c-type cytochrome n=1 Tax=Prosthecochloris sp. GSB1 TaxID=281093 RepID=UPI000B8C8271|nr:cytochrome c [Prosthecochloris sp. GSB1]ASQ90503.1 cytochrome C [Prosthecochloris sp. GSB1]